jgi:hypothetical protein
MGHDASLPCSQEPAIFTLYPEPDESSQHPHIGYTYSDRKTKHIGPYKLRPLIVNLCVSGFSVLKLKCTDL